MTTEIRCNRGHLTRVAELGELQYDCGCVVEDPVSSGYRPPRARLQFRYGDYEIELELGERLSQQDLEQAITAWDRAIEKLVVR